MTWSWKKALNFGLLRLNFSKKGVGYSLGVRGFRIGRDATGRNYTQTSIPNTGIYKRNYSGSPTGAKKWSLAAVVLLFLILLLVKLALK